ncbi:hypothetical protein ACPTHQ_15505, partial [Enterococcus faecalis]|uniref:hypothetical protein n=1 Tax=Enterococcus faecalis TaxID=1351 RepID=UPI003CC691BD
PPSGCGGDTVVGGRAAPVVATGQSGSCCSHVPGPGRGAGTRVDNGVGNPPHRGLWSCLAPTA